MAPLIVQDVTLDSDIDMVLCYIRLHTHSVPLATRAGNQPLATPRVQSVPQASPPRSALRFRPLHCEQHPHTHAAPTTNAKKKPRKQSRKKEKEKRAEGERERDRPARLSTVWYGPFCGTWTWSLHVPNSRLTSSVTRLWVCDSRIWTVVVERETGIRQRRHHVTLVVGGDAGQGAAGGQGGEERFKVWWTPKQAGSGR